jgi:hypothetical protein
MDKKLSPFDFLNSINSGIKSPDLFESERQTSNTSGASLDSVEKQYVPFMVNRGLSYFRDTVLYANEMNRYYRLSGKLQYDFLRTSIRPSKRFAKWTKKASDDDVKLVMDAYGYSMSKASAVVELLSESQKKSICQYLDKGGINKR